MPYGKGGNLTAVAYNGGREVARHQIATAGRAVRLVITPEPLPRETSAAALQADGMSLQYFTIRAVDKHGNTVPGFNEELTVEVEGEATLLALDNGDHYTDYLFHDVHTKHMHQGEMQVILRSTRKAGRITLRAKCPSLKSQIKLESK